MRSRAGGVGHLLVLLWSGLRWVRAPGEAPPGQGAAPTPPAPCRGAQAGSSTADAEALPCEGDGRQLQEITSALPSGLTVTIGDLPGVSNGGDISVVAGVNYSAGIRLALATRDFPGSPSRVARLRLVIEGTPARLGGCSQVDSYWPGGIGFDDAAISMLVNGGIAHSTGPIFFMLGGHYRICYSHDGSFGVSSELMEVPRNLQVRGAKIDCKTDRCFEEYRWNCFVYRDAPPPVGSCTLKFDSVEYIANTSATRLSWGPQVRIILGNVVGWTCADAPSGRILPGYQSPVPGSVGREFVMLPYASNEGFSVQACYCPAYDGCDAGSDFVQPVGRVHFFYSWICDDVACSNEFPAAHPGSPFALHISCAGVRACSPDAGNRVKVIDSSTLGVNDRPSWAENTGCRSATQSTSYWRPQNCNEGQVAQCGGPGGVVNGGTGSEVKVFAGLVIGPAYAAGVPMSRTFDVCYCDGRCEATNSSDAVTRFHKVGRILTRPYRLLAIRGSGTDTGIRAAGVASDLMVDGRGNIPLAPLAAQVKILWDNLRVKTSADCAGRKDLVSFPDGEGPSCTSDNDCSYKASTLETNPPLNFLGTGDVVNFNDGGTQGERMRFPVAGIIAICYCGVLTETGACTSEAGVSYWFLMARTVIRGPCVLSPVTERCVEDSWTFYTGIPFHLTLRGIGLKSTDKIRIIPESGICQDNPDGGGEPTVLKGCPTACSPLNLADTYVHGGGQGKDDVDLQITSSDTVGCGLGDAACRSARVLEVLPSADRSTWRFDADPELVDGDLVILDNVTGGTAEENALMAGRFGLEHLGWPITRTTNPLVVEVPAYIDHEPRRFSAGGGWSRHNVARTREELKGTVPKNLLQVCWGSGPDAYHARAGRISFLAPSAMPSALIAMSGFEGGRWSPVVVAFTTSPGGESALKYRRAENAMQLRLSFGDVARFEPRLADVDGQPLPALAPADRSTLGTAQQFVCGTLFLELWSDDGKGFPLPRGCYYSSLRQNTRDVHMVFEAKSGLEPGQQYHLVLNARVAEGASTLDRVLGLYSMDDVLLAPFGVVEAAEPPLSRDPRAPSGVGEPRFMSSGGLTLLDELGEQRQLLELATDPASLLLRLRGDGRSRIAAGSRLRVFLRPLTAWDLRATCRAQCIPHRTRTCGPIAGCACDAVVSGGRRSVIRLQLPSDMTEIYGATVQHTVRISELSLPRLGFFGTRFAAQISTPDDSRVHYVESSGAYVWKPPSAQDPQMTVASVVTREGDGNGRPFRGDAGNTLYVRLALGAALMAELAAGDALLRLRLPPGFSCRAVGPAPSTLRLFGSRRPQGRGSLPASGAGGAEEPWHLAGRSCEYRLRAGELIPAGSRLFLGLTVDQPDFPLRRADVLNRWSVELSSKGHYRWARQEAAAAAFVDGTLQDGELGDLGAAVPLLGKLLHDNLQPSDFQAGARRNVLQLFFRPEQRTGYRGRVLVDAPLGFNFAVELPDRCRVSRLAEHHYRTTGGQERTQYLPLVESCISECTVVLCPESTLNRAGLRIKNSLEPEFSYGFRLEVANKLDYSPGDEDAWAITTTDASGNRLDASYLRARLNPAVGGTARAWGVYRHPGDAAGLTLQVSSLRPTAGTGALSSVTIASIGLPATATATSRLIAPDGFSLTPVDFLFHASMVPGATASWPGGRPWQSVQLNPGRSSPHGDQARNVLLWDAATYLQSERYGFTSKLGVPERPVVRTSLVFILQFGWEAAALSDRPVAYALPLPQVRAITDLAVGYLSNVLGVRQLVSLVLQTSAAVPLGGALRVEVPGGFVFDERCSLEPVARLHVDLGLHAAKTYAFRIHVAANPTETPEPNLWTIEYAGESSTPFEGFNLWTFTAYTLQPTTVAASSSSGAVANPVVFRFRPHNEVPADPRAAGAGGSLRIEAPSSFAAATQGLLGRSCAPYLLLEDRGPFVPAIDLDCQPGGQERPNILSLQLIGSRKLEAGRLYELTAQFHNPLAATSLTQPWRVTTFNSPSGNAEATLDATSFPGYAVKARPSVWAVTKPDGEQHAGSVVPGVAFQAGFRSELTAGDKVLITAPAGFDLAAPRQCSPQVGRVLGGRRERVGSSTSLQHCADTVWKEAPAATACSWHIADFRCFAHFGVQSLDICAPVQGAANANQPAMTANSTALSTTSRCAGYSYHVCSFAGRSRACHAFQPGGSGQYPLSSSPVCEENTLLFRFGPGDVLPNTGALAFSITARNPTQRPNLTESLWIVEQYNAENVLEITAAASGWQVIPVLASVSVRLTGALRASGALSQLTIDFTPVSDADSARLTAAAPSGFDFSAAATAGAGRSVLQSSASSVTVACALTPGSPLSPPLVLDGVRLSDPGPATFRLATFKEAVKADEALSVSGGAAFAVPGRIEAAGRALVAAGALPANGSHAPLGLRPRINDLCIATFSLTFSAGAAAGDVLAVSARPFSFPAEQQGPGAFELSVASSGAALRAAASVAEGGAALELALADAVEAGTAYSLKLLVRAGPLVANGERWRFEARRPGAALPLSTNDAGVGGFALLHALSVSLSAGRVAPGALAEVRLEVDPGGSRPEQLLVEAPLAFRFPPGSCLLGERGPGATVLSCRRLEEEHAVELQLAAQGLEVPALALLAVRAPEVQDPAAENTWLVRARAQRTETGWGTTSGFSVAEMELVRLVYAGVPAMEANLAVVFSTTQGLLSGGIAELQAPALYKLICPERLGTLVLRGVQQCSAMGNTLQLALNETMAPGTYAFVVVINNPGVTPMENRFSFMLRGPDDSVVDARMLFEGNPMVQGLSIRTSQLFYSSTTAFTQAEVRVVLRVSAAIDPYQAIGAIRSLQIAVPERFALITREPVINLDGLPTPETSWFHHIYTERLIRIDLVRYETDTPGVIPAGDYRLSFQVRLPEFWIPSVNIWMLSLCRDLRCAEPVADTVMPGFYFGDAPTIVDGKAKNPSEQGGSGAQHGQRAPPRSLVVCAVAVLSWVASAAPPRAASTASGETLHGSHL